MDVADFVLLVVAGFAAGVINGIAGGGTMVSFPALLAVGIGPLAANVTSTVGIWTGYLGGVGGYRAQLASQRRGVRVLGPAAVAGALLGALLLLATSEEAFEAIAPALVFAAAGLFALQPVIRRRTEARGGTIDRPRARQLGIAASGAYGSYFGAGLGVLTLAVLGSTSDAELHDLNGVRALLALLINSIAFGVFVVAAPVDWPAAGTLAVTSLAGGWVGARTSLRMPPALLRGVVIVLGLAAGIGLLVS